MYGGNLFVEMSEFDDLMKIQNQIRQGLLREQSENTTIIIMSIINELTSGPNDIVQIESIVVEAINRGINEEEVIKNINQLKRDRVIFETKPGFLKKT